MNDKQAGRIIVLLEQILKAIKTQSMISTNNVLQQLISDDADEQALSVSTDEHGNPVIIKGSE